MDDRSSATTATMATGASRRDVLRVATGAASAIGVIGAIGAATYLVPRFNQVAPDDSELALSDSVDVDLAPLAPGQQVTVFWRSWPVWIIRRTAPMLATLQQPALVTQLADPDSRQAQQPPYAVNAGRSVKPEFAVLVGVCTHMGCTPQFYPQPSAQEPEPDWIGGFFCSCHGSKYDLAGRVFKDVPAQYNLPVPPHRFVNDRMLRIGENPPNAKFDFGTIVQI